jgi:cytochrome P460
MPPTYTGIYQFELRGIRRELSSKFRHIDHSREMIERWGWALFKSDAPDKQVATSYIEDCLSCHVPAKSTDWVYIKGHAVLASQ